MASDSCFEPLPQVCVLDRFLVRRSPAIALPLRQPCGDAVSQVRTVGVQPDRGWLGEALERLDGRHQFHPVIRGAFALAAAYLLGVGAVGEHRAPAAWPRVAAARAVGIELDDRPALFLKAHAAYSLKPRGPGRAMLLAGRAPNAKAGRG